MLKVSLKHEIRYYYSAWYTVPVQLVNEIGILIVFWLTAKAFVPSVEVFGNRPVDYFTFIVVGETVLRIPSFFIATLVRNLKLAAQEGILEHFLLLPVNRILPFFIPALSGSLLELIKIFTILGAVKIFFSLQVSSLGLMICFLLQFCSIGIFIGMGLISCSILLLWGRGEGFVLRGLSLASILAGAYFPTNVLPKNLQVFVDAVSPFNLLLNLSRQILTGETNYLLTGLLILTCWSLVFSLLGVALFHLFLHQYKRKDKQILVLS